jgi:hypothetical protein
MPVVQALEALEASFAATQGKCELAATAEPSVLIAQEIRATLETFGLLDQAMDVLYGFLERRELSWLHRGRDLLLEFAGRFSSHQQRLDQLREQQGKVLCPYCSHFSEPGGARCQRCAKPLPLNLGLPDNASTFQVLDHRPNQGASELLVTANLAMLYEAVKAIEENRLDADSFLAAIDKFEATLESGIERVPSEPSVDSVEVSDLYDLLDDGLAEICAGLKFLRGYPAARDQSTLLAGIQKMDSGAKKVAEAGARARHWKP